ncbi:MAG: type III pantothenate kinase [Bacteroidales bacterium]|jgi:type III pantothenate kinase|nr:type III pantothenate kinase [Bacteroidales bacterium]
MNLTIDIGNSRSKLAVIRGGEIIEVSGSDGLNPEVIQEITKRYPGIRNVILSTVRNPDPALVDLLKSQFENFIELTEETPIPIKNLYQTKNTLGKDRLASVVGANNIFPDTNVLVIDLGTAATFDLINEQNQYLGGNISPGLTMRFKALHHFTDRLPLLEKKDTYPLIARNTNEAIISGVLNGLSFEIDSYINTLKTKYNDLKVFLTGGDAIFFDKKLKNTIFVNLNLNFTGLNRILEYNIKA